MRKFELRLLFFIVLTSAFIGQTSRLYGQLNFNISSTGNADVDAGFQQAANFWASHFNDDATINITAGWQDLGAGILGSSQNASTNYNYSAFRNAVAGNIVTMDDQAFYDGLSASASFSVYANNTFGNPNGSGPYVATDLTNVFVNRSNAKALGLLDPHATANDSTIRFNSTFNFDFDPSDGITAGQIDFVGVAIHEIGHTMGFSSSVDIIGALGDRVALNNLGPSVLDFTRFSPDSMAAGDLIDITYDTRAKYYSIDGGFTVGAPGMNHWSLGGANDGRQASHWKDNLGLGIMDPTSAPAGQANVVTELDLQAIDVIGWNRFSAVPEPSSAAVLLLTVAMVSGMRRRRK